MLMWTGGLDLGGPSAMDIAPVTVSTGPSIQDAILSDLTDQEFSRLLVSDRNDPDDLLMIAATER